MSKIEGLVNIALKLESSINCYKAVSVFVQYRGLNVNSLFLHGMTSSHIFFSDTELPFSNNGHGDKM